MFTVYLIVFDDIQTTIIGIWQWECWYTILQNNMGTSNEIGCWNTTDATVFKQELIRAILRVIVGWGEGIEQDKQTTFCAGQVEAPLLPTKKGWNQSSEDFDLNKMLLTWKTKWKSSWTIGI